MRSHTPFTQTIGLLLAALILPMFCSAAAAVPNSDVTIDQGMRVEKDVAVTMSDGSQLRANIFRPLVDGKYPVIMTMSSYGKDIHFQDYNKPAWDELMKLDPGMCGDGSSCKYVRWEIPDPERWVPKGYIVIAVDARGSGKSPGYLDPFSARETHDYYDAIEWAGTQPWSNGKVGLMGISYYAVNEWQVAALRPPHLAAIIPWEGASDIFRDMLRQGGILGDRLFAIVWPEIVKNQYGNGASPFRDRETGVRTTGGPALSGALLAGNRDDFTGAVAQHPFDDAWMHDRTPDLARITTPVLSAGNWGGIGLHLRGNIEGYVNAGSQEKWLSVHTGTHFETFYQPQWMALQARFFDHYLKGADNGWQDTPHVQLTIRRPGSETLRYEDQWPLARTQWTKFFLNADGSSIAPTEIAKEGEVSYNAISDGVTFSTAPFVHEMEFTGPVSLRLWVSSSTTDMDIFATLRAFGPDGVEVTFRGANDPAAPVSQGWLRVSQRKLDPGRSKPYRPWHTHDEAQKLTPGEVYPVDVEIWPTSIVIPKGYRLALTVQGKDFERGEATLGVAGGTATRIPFHGSGPLLHLNANDRPPAEFAGVNTLHTGKGRESFLLLPVIPAASQSSSTR